MVDANIEQFLTSSLDLAFEAMLGHTNIFSRMRDVFMMNPEELVASAVLLDTCAHVKDLAYRMA